MTDGGGSVSRRVVFEIGEDLTREVYCTGVASSSVIGLIQHHAAPLDHFTIQPKQIHIAIVAAPKISSEGEGS